MSTDQQHTDQHDQQPTGQPAGPVVGGWRARVRQSRLGTLVVLGLTTALVMLAAYLVDRPSDTEAGAGGVTAVSLSGPSKGAAPKIGSPAQDFTATTVEGETVSLSDYRGQPVWLTFGASWCSACQAEAPDIQAAYTNPTSKAAGVVVLGVFINEDTATVADYGQRIGLSFPMVADPDTRIASAYRVLGIPAHYFIDKAGVLRAITVGSLSPERMDTALARISR
jgi:cytochrome c biogenesis protein CcmG, thiol:disulfide interchange protein DsbE